MTVLPEQLRLLGKSFSVLEARLGGGQRGECSAVNQAITIGLDQCPDQKRDTLLHEVIHALDDIVAIGLEERQVHALAGGLMAALSDNPDLADFLLSGDE